MSIPFIEENDQTRARQEHLGALRQLVGNVYPNKFERSQTVEAGREDTISAVVTRFRDFEPQTEHGTRPAPEAIELANQQLNAIQVRLAGRIASPPRVMGKAAFVHLSDGVTRLQIYVKRADVVGVRNDAAGGEVDGWELFNLLDHGDFIGVGGYLFITKTGELSVHVQKLQFLAKALLPLPDKMHGIHDAEIRQRQRYADLIAGSLKLEREEGELTPREVFERRSKVISEMRHFLEDHGYVEVETPMLTPLATGAAARPFETYHNALGIPLYARIAPELYLKRLLVGGFEKVYELNRNFRNEGIDRTHNPEFTMLEFYWAYADVNQMMDFCEGMLREVVSKAVGKTKVKFGEHEIDFFEPFERLTMKRAISHHMPPLARRLPNGLDVDEGWLNDVGTARLLARFITSFHVVDLDLDADPKANEIASYWRYQNLPKSSQVIAAKNIARAWEWALDESQWRDWTAARAEQSGNSDQKELGLLIEYLFGAIAEPRLTQPTFVTDFPKSISPLSKAASEDTSIAERFELFIQGVECANGFSELNDPKEQFERFNDQVRRRERGDEEAMVMDEDYIRALSYGMPPAAGIGIGIDRFVMLLTNRHSIRDVILFPHLRPERKPGEVEAEAQHDKVEESQPAET